MVDTRLPENVSFGVGTLFVTEYSGFGGRSSGGSDNPNDDGRSARDLAALHAVVLGAAFLESSKPFSRNKPRAAAPALFAPTAAACCEPLYPSFLVLLPIPIPRPPERAVEKRPVWVVRR